MTRHNVAFILDLLNTFIWRLIPENLKVNSEQYRHSIDVKAALNFGCTKKTFNINYSIILKVRRSIMFCLMRTHGPRVTRFPGEIFAKPFYNTKKEKKAIYRTFVHICCKSLRGMEVARKSVLPGACILTRIILSK